MDLYPIRRNNVTVTGNPDAGQSIVFVHGFGCDQSAWNAVAEAFMDNYRIVLLDNVGAGGADPEAFVQHRYLNLKGYARDLNEVCRALQLDKAILVGHSAGAMIGLLAAIDAPSHFAKIVLLGASPRYIDEPGYRGGLTGADINAIYDSVTYKYAAWADSFAPAMMGNPDRPQLAVHFADALKAIPADRALTVLCSILQSDHRAVLSQLRIPALVLQTRNDNAVPLEVAEYLQQNITGSQLTIIDTEGHLPHISAPEKVVAALMPFIGVSP